MNNSSQLLINIIREEISLLNVNKLPQGFSDTINTDSVLRIMTGWKGLSVCFWNQFNKTKIPNQAYPNNGK
jgi:hypothetical protein